MKIKVFGERNTGTNALVSVLRNNSRSIVFPGTLAEISPLTQKKLAVMAKLGMARSRREKAIDKVFHGRPIIEQWKHAATYFDINTVSNGVHFVFMVRDPLSWLVGLYKKPHHMLTDKPDGLLDFAEMNWHTVGRDNLPKETYKPLEMYAAKLCSYRDLIGKLERKSIDYTIVKFEDFVRSQKDIFEKISFYLDDATDEFKELTKSTKDANKDSNYYRKYYSKEVWRDEFPNVDRVKMPPEREIFSFFGYG